MAKIRNISDDDRLVPDLGRLVLAGQVVDVPDADVHAFTRQVDVWAPHDEEAQAAHDAGDADLARALNPSTALQGDEQGRVLLAAGKPSLSAPKPAWVAYLVATGHPEEGLNGLTKAELVTLGEEA